MSVRRQIGQLRPTSADAEVLFNPTENKPYTIDLINVVNTSSTQTIEVSIFHDADGTDYDEDTTVLWKCEVAPKGVLQFEPEKGISDYQKIGNIAVQSSLANTATFTAYGTIEGEVL